MNERCIWAEILLCSLSLALVFGCGESATKTAEKCAGSDLIAQCPPGTTPDLSAMATSMCGGEAEANLIMEAGKVTASCSGSGTCQVVCHFETPCDCGVDRITEEGVFCVPDCNATACGNGSCESGEDAATCPLDCGMRCESGTERCDGSNRQACNQNGVWEPLDCPPETQCVEANDQTSCDSICTEVIFYADDDDDGFGNIESPISACEAPDGYVSNSEDCDDEADGINPGATEVCDDEIDNDCDQRNDCDDDACLDAAGCIETDCGDGVDNDENGALDCDDTKCEADPLCAAPCREYCAQYAAQCLPPGFEDHTCRVACNAYPDIGEEDRLYQSNSLACRTLYLDQASNDVSRFCEQARPSDENEYCRPDGTLACETYCTMMWRFCPQTYMADLAGCRRDCTDHFADGWEGLQDVTTAAIACRLTENDLENIATPDGGACAASQPDSNACPRVYELAVIRNGATAVDGEFSLAVTAKAMSLFSIRNGDGGPDWHIRVMYGEGNFQIERLNQTLARGEIANLIVAARGLYRATFTSGNASATVNIRVE